MIFKEMSPEQIKEKLADAQKEQKRWLLVETSQNNQLLFYCYDGAKLIEKKLVLTSRGWIFTSSSSTMVSGILKYPTSMIFNKMCMV